MAKEIMEPESSAINIHSMGDVYRGWQNFLVRCWAVIWYLIKICMSWCQQLLASLCEPRGYLQDCYTYPGTGRWVCLRALSLCPKALQGIGIPGLHFLFWERAEARWQGTTPMSPTLAFYWKIISLSKFTWVPNLVYNVLTTSFTLKGEFCGCIVWGDSLPLANGRNVIFFSLLCWENYSL